MTIDKILYQEISSAMDRNQITSFEDISLTDDNEITLFLEDGTTQKLLIQEGIVGFDNLESNPIAQDLVEVLEAEFTKYGAINYKNSYNLALEKESDTFEIFIDDLKPEVQKQVIKFLGDNSNYDVFPMITLYKDGGEE